LELFIEVSSDLSAVTYRFGSVCVRNNSFRLVSDFFFLQSQATLGAIICSRLRFGSRVLHFDGLKIKNLNEAEVWGPSIDTFILIDAVRAHLAAAPRVQRSLDIGCGTGLIALWMAKQDFADRVYGVDISADAIRSARLNAAAAALEERTEFIEQPLASFEPDKQFQVVVCNPPYLPEGFHAGEYKEALNGPEMVRELLARYASWLTDDGKCFASLSAIAGLDPAVNRQLRTLENAGRARCLQRREIPFFIETILCDADKVERLSLLGGIQRRQHFSPAHWHEVQVWELSK
jgi:SAM-dependent methyltransferase